MRKSVLLLLFLCASVGFGQSHNAFLFDSSNAAVDAGAGSSAVGNPSPMPAGERRAPFGSLTESFVYIDSPHLYGADRGLMGWSVVPEVNLVHHVGLQADFASLYMRSIYPGQSRFLAAAGPRFNLTPRSKVTPFLFAEGGEIRLEAQRSHYVDWDPVVKAGFGFDYKITPRFGLTLVPGEYLGEYLDAGSWLHSYTTRVGLTFLLGGGPPSI